MDAFGFHGERMERDPEIWHSMRLGFNQPIMREVWEKVMERKSLGR